MQVKFYHSETTKRRSRGDWCGVNYNTANKIISCIAYDFLTLCKTNFLLFFLSTMFQIYRQNPTHKWYPKNNAYFIFRFSYIIIILYITSRYSNTQVLLIILCLQSAFVMDSSLINSYFTVLVTIFSEHQLEKFTAFLAILPGNIALLATF